MSEIFLITGANRGIGLAVTKILMSQGDTVFAACRQPGKAVELQNLKNQYGDLLELVPLEADSDASVKAAAEFVAKRSRYLDVLFNNAGISPQPYNAPLDQVEISQMKEAFEVNTLGPLRVSQAFLPLLKKAKNPRIINMTSGLASLSGKAEGAFYAYGVSKTALNMLTRTMAFDQQKDKVVCVCLDPGWVQTDMGGPGAPLKPEESAASIAKTMKGLTMKDTSHFIYNDGKELNW